MVQQAVAQQQAGQLDSAATLYCQVLQQMPTHYDALHMLGVIALQRGQLSEAEKLIRSALNVNCQDAAAHYNLGIVLRQMGRAADSLAPLKQAFALNANSADVCGMLGASLSDIGDTSGAREALIRAVKLTPDDAIVHKNFGDFLRASGDLSGAVKSFTRAIVINPAMKPALENLALSYFEMGNIDQSMEAFTRLIALSGADAATHYVFGNALMTSGNLCRAIEEYQRAIELEPEHGKAHWAIAMAQLRPIYENVKDIEESRRAFANAISTLDAWFTPSRAMQGELTVGSTQPFYLAYQAGNNRSIMQTYGQLCTRLMHGGTLASRHLPMTSVSMRKLRIGFVSAHVHDHSVWNALTKGWVQHLDPLRFEVHVFSLGRVIDDETMCARGEATDFIDTPRTLADWKHAILEAELDALVYPEIGMNPQATQLAAQRLAPVQAASWGHPDTTGLPTIDLFLSAELLEPTDGDAHYTEKLVRLPNLGVYVEPLAPVSVAPDLAALGLPINEALLLCPGQLFKYSPEHDQVWARLALRLQSLGKGRLVFFRSPRVEMTQQFELRLRRAFTSVGANFEGTVCLIPTLPREQFYGLMQRATLMLDTIGFSGFNTALQGLECGLPLIAYEGEFMRGRLASGLLRRMGLDNWVATSNTEFVDMAMRLTIDESVRRALCEQILETRSILFKDLAPVRALEDALVDAVTLATQMRETSL